MEDKVENKKNINLILILLGVFVILAAGLWFVSANNNPDTSPEYLDEELSTAPDVDITTDDVLDNPEQYIGQTVTVSSEIEDWISTHAVTLDAPGVVNDRLLIITEDPQFAQEDPQIFGDAVWQATGEVQMFEIATVQQTYGFDLDPEVFVDFENVPYIAATSFEKIAD